MSAAAAVLAAAPMLVTAATFVARQPQIVFDGDPALDELALIRSTHFEQLVGNYSRFGWSHPGPAWFYALDVFYVPLGQQSWAMVAATLGLHAVAVLLIVWLAHRLAGMAGAVVAGGLLLVYVGLISDQLFRGVWPPFAVILPMAVFLLLAAFGAAGSTPALAASLVAGSYEAQTHVGTVPTVIAVVVAAVALRVVMDSFAAHKLTLPAPGNVILTAAALLVAFAMWVPPLIDEVTGHPGNLTVLFEFFTTHGAQHRWSEAVSALGQYVNVFELHQLTGRAGSDAASTSVGDIASASVFTLLCGLLALAGTRARDRLAQSVGVILLAAIGAITISIRDVLGPVYGYLLFWVTMLPLVLALGWLAVLIRHRPRFVPSRIAAIALVTLVALSGLRIAAFQNLPADHGNAPRVDYISVLTDSAVAADPNQPVLMEFNSLDMWTLAAGVGLQLVKHGHPIRVERNWEFMFGRQSRIKGDERLVLTLMAPGQTAAYQSQYPDAVLVASTEMYAVFLRRLP